MQIDKSQIIEMLKSMGEQGKADQAGKELPDKVDTDQHADKLSQLGIDPKDLISKLGGGGLGGLLGG
jgi:hypothetical protein